MELYSGANLGFHEGGGRFSFKKTEKFAGIFFSVGLANSFSELSQSKKDPV